MKKVISLILTASLLCSLTACSKSSSISEFPDPEKTITLIVPQSAGGGTDTQARALVEAMKEVSGKSNIIVENVTGGSTGTGTNQVIDSEADGYTLLMYGTYVACGTMTGYTEGFNKLDYIAGLNVEPFVLAVNKQSNYGSLADLIKAAQEKKGQLTLGNAGATATTGIVAYGLNNVLDTPFNVVAFNGGAELIPAVLGGHCDAGIFSQSEVIANLEGLRPLVFFGKGHSVIKELSDVPNLAEAGYEKLDIPSGCFRGICVPQGVNDNVKQYLADIIEKAYKTEKFQKFMTEQGLLDEFSKLNEFKLFNDKLVESLKPIIKSTGLAKGVYAK